MIKINQDAIDSANSSIEAIRANFSKKEQNIKNDIISLHSFIASTTEEEVFLQRQLEIEIEGCAMQIERLHQLAYPSVDAINSMNRADKKIFISNRKTYLEQIASLAMRIVNLRKNGLPQNEKEDCLNIYRTFKAMSPEDLAEYIRNCVEKQLELANKEIARLEDVKDSLTGQTR